MKYIVFSKHRSSETYVYECTTDSAKQACIVAKQMAKDDASRSFNVYSDNPLTGRLYHVIQDIMTSKLRARGGLMRRAKRGEA